MPGFVQGSPYSAEMPNWENAANITYQYPEGMNLKPGSPLHEKLKMLIRRRALESYAVMQKRFNSWNQIDETLTAYIRTDDHENAVLDDDERRPVSVVVPYSYASLETLLTYTMTAFLQKPIFEYSGTGPEDTIGATLLEMVIHKQCERFKVGLPLHTVFRDSLAYGIGFAAPYWSQVIGQKTRAVSSPIYDLFGNTIESKQEKRTTEEILYEGNAVDNIDPYKVLPDPNYPIQHIQRMEFFGWQDTISLMDLLSLEKGNDDIFNSRYLKHLSSRRSTMFRVDDSSRAVRYGGRNRYDISEAVTHPVDRIHMFMKLIPRDYGLPGGQFNPNGEYPEKWFFTLASEQVIITAKPLGLDHDMFPVCVAAPDFDGYSTTPISRLEIVYGLQHVLNFLFNSHVANVRKAINDMLVYDPWMINSKDLKNPKPGKLIRTRRQAWGHGVKDYIAQLNVVDVTANHMRDAHQIMDFMDRSSAASQSMQGIMSSGERKSATEFEGTHGSSMSRLQHIAQVIGLQLMQDLGHMFASHTQQFMSEETFLKVEGKWEKLLLREFGPDAIQKGRIGVNPMQVLVDYDVEIRDGSTPGGNMSRTWLELFQIAASQPAVAARVDLFRVFLHIARGLGAQDVYDFELKQQPQPMNMPNVQSMPDEDVQREAQKGNLVPFPMGSEQGQGGIM